MLGSAANLHVQYDPIFVKLHIFWSVRFYFFFWKKIAVYICILGILFYKEYAVTFNSLESSYRTHYRSYLWAELKLGKIQRYTLGGGIPTALLLPT